MGSHWGNAIKRSQSHMLRKEDECNLFFELYNETTRGSVNTFTGTQLVQLNEIASKADEFLKNSSIEFENFDIFRCCPIYLVSYTECVEEGKNRCKSPFAEKMRELYCKEIDGCSEEDKEKIYAKYRPWICGSVSTSCDNCKKVFSTPLGYYRNVNGEGEIFICLDKIIEDYPKEVIAIAATVVFHEIGHHVMYNDGYPSYKTPFDYWVEESLANRFALKYMKAASIAMNDSSLYDSAKNFVSSQSEPYSLGLYLFEHNALDCKILQQNKTNINQTIGDKWVEAVCVPSKRNICDVNRLFYRSFEKNAMISSSSSFEAYILAKNPTWGKKYAAVVNSPYMGVVFKEIMGWRYNTLSECTSVVEVKQLHRKLLEPGSAEQLFNSATSNVCSAAVGHYRDYLLGI